MACTVCCAVVDHHAVTRLIIVRPLRTSRQRGSCQLSQLLLGLVSMSTLD